jgi:hypothetical protein
MSDKFTYIDFLMYVLPGAFLSFVILILIWSAAPATVAPMLKADLFSSVILLIFSFILGNFLQVRSHLGPEERLKKEFWTGLFPSQTMFFPGNKILNESGREDLINACFQKGLLTNEDATLFSAPTSCSKKATDKAQNAFDYMRTHLVDGGKGERIRGAEGYFLFFRGMFVASFWSTTAFVIVALIYLARLRWPILNNVMVELPGLLVGFVVPILGASFSMILWRTFRYRCRGAAQGFAKEVARAFCVTVFIEGPNKQNI